MGNDFLDTTPKAQATNESKQIHWTTSQLNFCASEDTINRIKGQPTEGEKIYTNQISEKGLISRTHKELVQLSSDNDHRPNVKMSKGPEHTFPQGEHTNGQ